MNCTLSESIVGILGGGGEGIRSDPTRVAPRRFPRSPM
ncbi:hypothetical protein Rrhod_2370 [Rhodococcus rhodnii LMG 5362]|uniref:Uncharacterized protein n=1 Tax=Rhodococcus rhodnii LMG 5362 TaxID=1273125 RepID=R7WLV8_9NOCA|nr:hypothetical protein Rrhod_2370 [Rhodococcus rhodnii LMG 5362]